MNTSGDFRSSLVSSPYKARLLLVMPETFPWGFSTIYFLSNFWMFGDIGQGLSAINVFSPLVTITSCSSGLSVIQHSVPWKIEAKKMAATRTEIGQFFCLVDTSRSRSRSEITAEFRRRVPSRGQWKSFFWRAYLPIFSKSHVLFGPLI